MQVLVSGDSYSKCQLNVDIIFNLVLENEKCPPCVHGKMTSHIAAMDHVTSRGVWLNCKGKLLITFVRNESDKMIANVR